MKVLMRRLSRIKGHRDSQIKRFNEMYEKLREDVAADEDENSKATVLYTQSELDEFRSYLILAEADERQRISAMRYKRSLNDFTLDEIARFDHMQEVLIEFNKLLDNDEFQIELIIPPYSDIEMMEHIQYRELWIAHFANL